MKRSLLVAGLVVLGVSAAIAQSNPVEQRQGLMKQLGSQVRTASAMLKGQAPFDLGQAKAALETFSTVAKQAPGLFPDSSKAEKSDALPTVWENKAAFDSNFSQFEKDAQTALASIKDEATFKTEFPKVLQNCGTCHKTFRKG
ncbi:c-type cytochrome [Microvirga flavescens]|uniref:c-type cytochrome n=1 Tax=Microvirga flavescens TaxID=2249811 RepID=UPI000DDB67DF|nr:cytochrome c [Microvirga flavescens]